MPAGKWQLSVFDAIICSKLLYGSETIHLTQAMYKRINHFQYRSLRRILEVPPTFISRADAKKKLLRAATALAFPTRGDCRKLASFNNYLQAIKSAGPNCWDMCQDQVTKALCGKSRCYRTLLMESTMKIADVVAPARIGCISRGSLCMSKSHQILVYWFDC